MALLVQKYGGSSLADVQSIQRVAARIATTVQKGHGVIVVLSAMQGETDRLISLAKSLSQRPCSKEYDALLAVGEQASVALMSICLRNMGLMSVSMNAAQAGIHTNSDHQKAHINWINPEPISQILAKGEIPVVTGFQGVNDSGEVTTLGRGGSDITAVALAAAFTADECQIFTDVCGIFTADPRIEPRARLMPRVSFEEMLELSSLGAKVLQRRAVELAGRYKVVLRISSSFEDDISVNTLITYKEDDVENEWVCGVTSDQNQARLSLVDIPNSLMIGSKIFGTLSSHGIEVDMIAQSTSADGMTLSISFTLRRDDYYIAKSILHDLIEELNAGNVMGCDWMAKVSIVGMGMRSHAGIATTLYKTLGDAGIAIDMVTTSEIKLSVIIDEKYSELAVRSLHDAYKLFISANQLEEIK